MLFALHIPDGFLPPQLCGVGWLLALGPVLWALRQCSRSLEERTVPLMGMMAAFVLVAQGLQFPVPGGTSAHLQGAALTALTLGTWPSVVVLTSVIIVQGLVLGDGGLLSMGWNLVNMALVGGLSATFVYGLGGRSLTLRVVAATWVSVQLSTLAACLELAWGQNSPLQVSIPVMLGAQAVVALGESLVTLGALRVLRTRPASSSLLPGLVVCAVLLTVSLVPPGGWQVCAVGLVALLPALVVRLVG